MKYLTLMTLVFAASIAQADFWDNCTAYGGTIITANSYGNDKGGLCNDPSNPDLTNNCNGKRFCVSGNKMNWWSAFTWCESIGGKLAPFSSVCPGTLQAVNSSTGACPNVKNIDNNKWAYTGTGLNGDQTFLINLSSAAINNDAVANAWRHFIRHAICEEK